VRVRVELVTIVVEEYDPAIAFFTDVLGFELVEDSPSLTNDGRPKRWVVVRPPGAEPGILLAVSPTGRRAETLGAALEALMPGADVVHFPAWETLLPRWFCSATAKANGTPVTSSPAGWTST